jgi:hypothetical protein
VEVLARSGGKPVNLPDVGLMDYKARFYDLRFTEDVKLAAKAKLTPLVPL